MGRLYLRPSVAAVEKRKENAEHAPPSFQPISFRAMTFKDSTTHFQIVDLSIIDPDPKHARQSVNEETLKGLTNAVQKLGIIHPIIVRPSTDNRYVVVAGERRRRAAIQAGETQVPVIIRSCSEEEALAVQVFENIGLGVRSALEPRDMANAIQALAERFESPEEAAQYFGRAPTWLTQVTAPANLSEKVTALLDTGKISSTSVAVQIEKLAKKNEAKAESLIEQIEQLPDGEKMSKKAVDVVLSAVSGRADKIEDAAPVASQAAQAIQQEPAAASSIEDVPPWEHSPREASPPSSPANKVHPGKVKLVAELLGLSEDDEETILARLIDEFLALRQA